VTTPQSPELADLRARWGHIAQQWDSISAAIDSDLSGHEPYVSLGRYRTLFEQIEEIVAMLTP
jgi:hypothetical protein